MAAYKWQDKEYPLIPYDEWTAGELSVVEHAFGVALDGSSTGDIAAAMFVVAVLRVEPETPPVVLIEVARKMPMSALAIAPAKKEEGPLVEETNGHVDPLTSGLSPLVPTE